MPKLVRTKTEKNLKPILEKQEECQSVNTLGITIQETLKDLKRRMEKLEVSVQEIQDILEEEGSMEDSEEDME